MIQIYKFLNWFSFFNALLLNIITPNFMIKNILVLPSPTNFKIQIRKNHGTFRINFFIKVVCYCDKHPISLEENRYLNILFFHTAIMYIKLPFQF